MGAYAEEKEGASSRPKERVWVLICVNMSIVTLLFGSVFGAIFYFVVWRNMQTSMFPDYTVAIDAVTGLNPATDMQQGRGVLSPVFNLTIGIAARNVVEEKCIKPGTTIRVSYSSLRLPLAAGRTPEMCVGAPPSSERRAAVARGHDVAIPGFLVDTLAEALRRGEAVFEVKLTSLARDDEYGAWDVVTCLVTAGMNSSTSKPCRLSSESSDSIPVPQQGDSSYVPHPTVPADAPVPH